MGKLNEWDQNRIIKDGIRLRIVTIESKSIIPVKVVPIQYSPSELILGLHLRINGLKEQFKSINTWS